MKSVPNPKEVLVLKISKSKLSAPLRPEANLPQDLDLALVGISGYSSLIREVEFKSLEYPYPFGVCLKTGMVTVNLNELNLPHKVVGFATKTLLEFAKVSESQILTDLTIQKASVRSANTCLVLRELEKATAAKRNKP